MNDQHQQPTDPAQTTANEGAQQQNIPPFTGSLDEALLFMELPPMAKIKRRLIVRISEQGSVPEVSEEMIMTRNGKVLARTEFMVMDGNNTVGRPEDLKGFCVFCQRFSFQGKACEICAAFCCSVCSRPFQDPLGNHYLCAACEREARRSKRNWG